MINTNEITAHTAFKVYFDPAEGIGPDIKYFGYIIAPLYQRGKNKDIVYKVQANTAEDIEIIAFLLDMNIMSKSDKIKADYAPIPDYLQNGINGMHTAYLTKSAVLCPVYHFISAYPFDALLTLHMNVTDHKEYLESFDFQDKSEVIKQFCNFPIIKDSIPKERVLNYLKTQEEMRNLFYEN